MSELTEDERLALARAGDGDALASLLEGATAELRGSLGGKIPARWSALLSVDDLLQQTFTDAFLGVAKFVPVGEGAFNAWLKTMARNNLRDALRALEAEKRGGGRAPLSAAAGSSANALYESLLANSAASPSRVALRQEASSTLIAALDRLPENQRRVVQHYDLDGESIEQVAVRVGKSQGAVYLLRHRAHARLRELLAP